MAIRGVLRHERFDASVDQLAQAVPRLKEAVDGAIWALCRHPEFGVKNTSIGVWQARIVVANSPSDVLLFYNHNHRLVFLLTVVLASSLN